MSLVTPGSRDPRITLLYCRFPIIARAIFSCRSPFVTFTRPHDDVITHQPGPQTDTSSADVGAGTEVELVGTKSMD